LLEEAPLEVEAFPSTFEERLELALVLVLELVLSTVLALLEELVFLAGDPLDVFTLELSCELFILLEEAPSEYLEDSLVLLDSIDLTLPLLEELGLETLELSVFRILLVLPGSTLRVSLTRLGVAVLFTLALFQCEL
jgi:hypothetical protein